MPHLRMTPDMEISMLERNEKVTGYYEWVPELPNCVNCCSGCLDILDSLIKEKMNAALDEGYFDE